MSHAGAEGRPLGVFADQSDIGAAGGAARYDAERQRYHIAGGGANVWGAHDSCRLVWRRQRGDVILTASAAFDAPGGQPHRKLGWMLRAGPEADAPHVSAVVHGDGLTSLQFRRAPGAPTEELRLPISGASVIQLERVAGVFRVSAARAGELFASQELSGIDLGDEPLAGLFVCAHDEAAVETATFHNVRVVEPAGPGFARGRDPFASHMELLDVASGVRTIIRSEAEFFEAPNWTPDGQALIYNQGGRIYRLGLAGGDVTPIDTGSVVRNNNDHVISFDGSMLAISSHTEDGHSNIFVVPVGGGEPRRVTATGPSYLHGWSPDGQSLVYTGLRDGDYDIYRIPAAGGPEERLTTAPGLDDGPEYSPDGRYIYFNSVRSGLMQIWRMRADGSGQEQLTDDQLNNWFPHLSPDGRWVVFLSYADYVAPHDHPAAKRCYLRIMPAEGGEPRVLAYLYGGQGTINVPSWAPDGRALAFVSNTVTLF